ncbi:hypothetical protein TNCV_5081591 [Trichonephila clavipes]|nr:hypothetical protein TNCV_5081591 [Trichonephila clavipes]
MTPPHRLDDSSRWRAVDRLEDGHSQADVAQWLQVGGKSAPQEWGMLFSVMSRNVPNKVTFVDCSSVETMELAFIPFTEQKLADLGANISLWLNVGQLSPVVRIRCRSPDQDSIEYVWDGVRKAISQRSSPLKTPSQPVISSTGTVFRK